MRGPTSANDYDEIMHALYRKPFALPSLMLALLLPACDANPPPKPASAPVSHTYLEALQEAEAAKHGMEERNLEQQRIDELLGRHQAPAR